MYEIGENKCEEESLAAGAFLLRFWQENKGEPMRFMLRSVRTEERLLFRSRDEMIDYLDKFLMGTGGKND